MHQAERREKWYLLSFVRSISTGGNEEEELVVLAVVVTVAVAVAVAVVVVGARPEVVGERKWKGEECCGCLQTVVG